MKKMFFCPKESPKHLEKISKFAKNEVKAGKVAVSAALRDMLEARCGVSAAPCGMSVCVLYYKPPCHKVEVKLKVANLRQD